MPRWLSFLISYFAAFGFYVVVFRTTPIGSLQDFLITLPGYLAAVMTDPPFWLITALIFFTLRSQWVFMKEKNN